MSPVQAVVAGRPVMPKGHHGGGDDDAIIRWNVRASYRTEGEPLLLQTWLKELAELDAWVEHETPSWTALIDMRIAYVGPGDFPLVLSAADVARFKGRKP